MFKYALCMLLMLPTAASASFGAAGNKIDYLDKEIKLDYAGSGPIVVATLDTRTYILDGDKGPDFVGLTRGGFGNPFQVRTLSGHALSKDVSDSVAAALTSAGFSASTDTLEKDETADMAAARIASKAGSRVVIVQLRQWKTDSYASTTLRYDVTISVYGTNGKLIDSVAAQGDEGLDVKVGFSLKKTLAAISVRYHEKFQTWLNDGKIRSALATEPMPAAAATR